MESPAACLSESIVFNGLDAKDIDALVPLFSRWTVMPGEILARAGHLAQFFFLLEQGTLLVSMEAGRAVVLSSSGDFAGLSMVSLDGKNVSTVTVLEKGGVWVVPCLKILELTGRDTQVGSTILEGWQQYLETKAPFCSNPAKAGINR